MKHSKTIMPKSINAKLPMISSSPSSTLISKLDSMICYRQLSNCYADQLMFENQTNFKHSSALAQVMYYHGGFWVDFPNDVVKSLQCAFKKKEIVTELLITGTKYIFDYVRMVQIDLRCGNQRSIAWIDEKGKYFFPKTFIGEESMDDESNSSKNIEIQIDKDGGNKEKENLNFNKDKKEVEVNSTLKLIKVDDKLDSPNGQSLISKFFEISKWPNTILLTQKDHGSYLSISDLFLSGIKNIDHGAIVTTIHQCVYSVPPKTTLYRVFESQNESLKAFRGSSNTVYAWYATSIEILPSILTYGFALPSKTSRLPPYGAGIYLTPVSLPHLSATQYEVDNNGEKHIILCQVILGNVEKVEVGSQQSMPSSENFDSGSDDPQNPNWYVVWSSNMNKHILPEFVVSYRPSIQVIGQLGMPNRTRYSFSKLLALHTCLPSTKLLKAISLYNIFMEGKLMEDIFVRHLREIIGDQKFRSIIQEEI